MKIRNLTLLLLFMTLFTLSAAWCDVIEDIIANDRELENIENLETSPSGSAATRLRLHENALFEQLLDSKEDSQRFIEVAGDSQPELLNRFIDRVRFEVSQEKRSDLNFLLEGWNDFSEGESATVRGHKKVVFIYGFEVNLLDGEWHNAPDGRRFWVSNEYPDVVLSPAEYRRHFKNAATVED